MPAICLGDMSIASGGWLTLNGCHAQGGGQVLDGRCDYGCFCCRLRSDGQQIACIGAG